MTNNRKSNFFKFKLIDFFKFENKIQFFLIKKFNFCRLRIGEEDSGLGKGRGSDSGFLLLFYYYYFIIIILLLLFFYYYFIIAIKLLFLCYCCYCCNF